MKLVQQDVVDSETSEKLANAYLAVPELVSFHCSSALEKVTGVCFIFRNSIDQEISFAMRIEDYVDFSERVGKLLESARKQVSQDAISKSRAN